MLHSPVGARRVSLHVSAASTGCARRARDVTNGNVYQGRVSVSSEECGGRSRKIPVFAPCNVVSVKKGEDPTTRSSAMS